MSLAAIFVITCSVLLGVFLVMAIFSVCISLNRIANALEREEPA